MYDCMFYICMYIRFSEAFALNCYIGQGNQYDAQTCLNCINVDCLCVKLPNFQERGEERFCLPNPHRVKPPGKV